MVRRTLRKPPRVVLSMMCLCFARPPPRQDISAFTHENPEDDTDGDVGSDVADGDDVGGSGERSGKTWSQHLLLRGGEGAADLQILARRFKGGPTGCCWSR